MKARKIIFQYQKACYHLLKNSQLFLLEVSDFFPASCYRKCSCNIYTTQKTILNLISQYRNNPNLRLLRSQQLCLVTVKSKGRKL